MLSVKFMCVVALMCATCSLSLKPTGKEQLLSEAEMWSIQGGDIYSKCLTSMGRCYAWPDGCAGFGQGECDGNVFYTSLGPFKTCQTSADSEQFCIESITQIPCMTYTHCKPVYDDYTGSFIECVTDGDATQDSTKGPESSLGSEC